MKKQQELHSPTLASILMVEKVLSKHREIGTYQLWCKLPRKMMYQTLQLILKYLEKSEKISVNNAKIKLMKKAEEKEKPEQEKEVPGYVC